MNGDPKANLTKLERLAALLRDDDVDIEKLNEAQLVQYLKDSNVDLVGPQKRFEAILKKAEARRRLEVASKRREEAVTKAKAMLSSGTDAVRVRVRELIDKFKQKDPDLAQVYAREFEKATPDDLATLEEDLKLLEMEPDDTSDQQDAR